MKKTTVDLLRHGEAQGGKRYRGRTDDPLTAKGWRQMRQQTANWSGDCVISSPLARCREFAEELSARQRIPIHLEAGWREIDFGDWEGRTAGQIAAEDPDALNRYYADPAAYPPPNGENHVDFRRRVAGGWLRMLENHAGRRLLVITHAGVIRALFIEILGISFRNALQIEIGHASLSRFVCHHQDGEPFIQLSFHKPI